MITNGIGFGGDINAITARRVVEPQGTKAPVRVLEIAGHALPLYPSQSPSDALPWPDLEALCEMIGLADDRRIDFCERHGIRFPALVIVKTATGKVAVVSPDAALRCVEIAARAGLPPAIVEELRRALSAPATAS